MRHKSIWMFAILAALLLVNSPLSAQNTISVTNACASEGAYGLQVDFNASNSRAYVQDTSPEYEPVYRASFDFNPNAITMATGDAHSFFTAWRDDVWDGVGIVPAFQLYVYNRGGKYVFRGIASYNSDNKRLATGFLPLGPVGSSRVSKIIVEFITASAPGVGDGSLTVALDRGAGGIISKSVASKNSAMFVDWVNLGPFQSIETTTVGSYCFDDFQSFRTLMLP